MAKTKINALHVHDVLTALAQEQPERRDRRAGTGLLEPKYVEHGEPACIVAAVMHRLGISIGAIKMLDREVRGSGGVMLRVTESVLRRRFTPAAWMLLVEMQRYNDGGRPWSEVVPLVIDRGFKSHVNRIFVETRYPWVQEIEVLRESTF